jgi:hypothetical protein
MFHIDVPTMAEFRTLALARDDACVSIYVPTSPIPTDAQANRLAFEDIAEEATDAELADAALPILERLHQKDIASVLTRCAEPFPRLVTDDVSYAAHAARAGAVEKLVVDLDTVVPGTVREFDGNVTYAASDTADVYSVVDEAARRALLSGAHVLAARSEELPKQKPLVAILRYPFGVAREAGE